MQVVKVSAQTREPNGKKGTKAVRAEGLVPGVIYGGGDVTPICFTSKSVKSLVYTPDFKTAEIEVNGKTENCILKDISFHPVTDEIVHIDFLRLIDGTPIKVDLPVKFTGVSPGVKLGGKLIPQLRKVKVKTLPAKLTDHLIADIGTLGLGDSVRVRDLEKIEGVEIMVEPATPVGLIEIPRALRSAGAAAEAAAEAEEA